MQRRTGKLVKSGDAQAAVAHRRAAIRDCRASSGLASPLSHPLDLCTQFALLCAYVYACLRLYLVRECLQSHTMKNR